MLFQIHIDLCKRLLCIYDSYNMYSIDGYMHVHEVITKKVNTFSQVVNLNIINRLNADRSLS